jgi:hypothetical protein
MYAVSSYNFYTESDGLFRRLCTCSFDTTVLLPSCESHHFYLIECLTKQCYSADAVVPHIVHPTSSVRRSARLVSNDPLT